MGGFESWALARRTALSCPIYIPLWVDLKATALAVAATPVMHLHSIMGGFERQAVIEHHGKRYNLHSIMGGFESRGILSEIRRLD